MPVRSVLVALLLACTGVVLNQLPAHSCSCARLSVQQDVKRADAVFTGVLAEPSTGSTGGGRRGETTYRIDAETLYKGELPRSRVKVTSPGNSCGLGRLVSDRRYVFFVTERGADLRSDRCGGTDRARGGYLEKVEKVAGAGATVRPAEPAEPVEPKFGDELGAEPPGFPRLAAPGFALTLIGLLGLLLVRRRGRG